MAAARKGGNQQPAQGGSLLGSPDARLTGTRERLGRRGASLTPCGAQAQRPEARTNQRERPSAPARSSPLAFWEL